LAIVEALLTNPTGLEVQIKFRWQGKNRYVNNLYVPVDSTEDWDLHDTMLAIQDESGWVSDLADAMHTSLVIESITGRVRGRDDAGSTDTLTVEQAGLKTGGATPSWMTFNVWQIPDNANRLIVSGTPSLFKRGRIAFPGVVDVDLVGNNLDTVAAALFQTAAINMASIPEVVGAGATPGFGLVMTRLEQVVPEPGQPYILRAKANITAMVPGKPGTQLTAR